MSKSWRTRKENYSFKAIVWEMHDNGLKHAVCTRFWFEMFESVGSKVWEVLGISTLLNRSKQRATLETANWKDATYSHQGKSRSPGGVGHLLYPCIANNSDKNAYRKLPYTISTIEIRIVASLDESNSKYALKYTTKTITFYTLIHSS